MSGPSGRPDLEAVASDYQAAAEEYEKACRGYPGTERWLAAFEQLETARKAYARALRIVNGGS